MKKKVRKQPTRKKGKVQQMPAHNHPVAAPHKTPTTGARHLLGSEKHKQIFLPMGMIIFAVFLFIDQYTKQYFVQTFLVGQSVHVLPGLWYTYVQNTGITWGLLQNVNGLMIWLSIIILGFLIFLYDHFHTVMEKISYTLLLGGLSGNLLDRVMYGFVVDFIDFRFWPVFNVADACITVGIIILLLEQWRRKKNTI